MRASKCDYYEISAKSIRMLELRSVRDSGKEHSGCDAGMYSDMTKTMYINYAHVAVLTRNYLGR